MNKIKLSKNKVNFQRYFEYPVHSNVLFFDSELIICCRFCECMAKIYYFYQCVGFITVCFNEKESNFCRNSKISQEKES